MAPTPKVNDFVDFSDIDPLSQNHCIWHLPDKDRRCILPLNPENRSNAAALKHRIVHFTDTDVSLATLERYALLNCCRRWHYTRIEEVGIIQPLARRWQEELRHHQISSITRSPQHATSSIGPLQSSQVLPALPASITPRSESPVFPRYNLRSQGPVESQSSAPLAAESSSHTPEFRPHKVYPPQNVSSVLLKPLSLTDKKPGSIYLFSRTTSPGFIKIGYTSRRVQTRLAEWKRDCGYVPVLVGSFSDVPNVKRVETLIHFALYKLWRKEVWCSRCARQHVEWFDIATDEAVGTVRAWTEWMREAQPYDSNGMLSDFWRTEVQRLEALGQAVTAEALLDIYHADRKRTSAEANEDGPLSMGISTPAADSTVANALAAPGRAQFDKPSTPNTNTQRPPPKSRPIPTGTHVSLNNEHVNAIVKAIQALTLELARRSSTLDGEAVRPVSPSTSEPRSLVRHDTNPTTLTACA